ncbi:uncharacterized protein [Miscanthus floridulus]|uniref:uncharacterized protein n=1 Tax=Miscanthus floridulus TaxID=154761 RepID=UPI00345A1E9A
MPVHRPTPEHPSTAPAPPFLGPRSSSSMSRPMHRPTLEHLSTASHAAVPSPVLLFFDADAHAAPHAGALPTPSTARRRSTTEAFRSACEQLLSHPHGNHGMTESPLLANCLAPPLPAVPAPSPANAGLPPRLAPPSPPHAPRPRPPPTPRAAALPHARAAHHNPSPRRTPAACPRPSPAPASVATCG